MLTACGTSWHAALVGEYLIEEFARIPVEVEYASELRYRNPPLDNDTLLFAITQSGETADTLAALREMKRKGHPTLAICNVVGSTIAQEADGGIYLHAGPEIGVASTKAFTSQCVDAGAAGPVLRPAAAPELRRRACGSSSSCRSCPTRCGRRSRRNDDVRRIAAKYCHCNNFLYLGRQYNFPDGAGRRAEAQGNQLHPRRRLSGRRDEARPDRAGRRAHAQRVHRFRRASCTTR